MATTGSDNCTVGTCSLHNTETSTSKIFALPRECFFSISSFTFEAFCAFHTSESGSFFRRDEEHCAYKTSYILFPRDWGHRSHLIRNDVIQHGCISRSVNWRWHGYNRGAGMVIIVPCRTVTDNRATCERSISLVLMLLPFQPSQCSVHHYR